MRITDYMNIEWICLNINENDKKNAIQQLFNKIKDSNHLVKNSKKILDAIFAREELMSTGVGSGIALPHAKTNLCPDFYIGIGISPQGIDYGAIDNNKVKIICLLLGPEKEPNKHIKFLSKISKILNQESVRQELINAKKREDIFNIFLENESK
ncbi:MAG: PTS sugar transporter subunit IIA [Calditrichia bacterium]|nr:PTS sugar transporter subunit IIA [Calditrichia bacterium]